MEKSLELVATISGGVVGFFVGLLLASAIAAVALRLAAMILGFGELRYFTAFKAALLANFVAMVLQFAVGFNFGFATAMSRYAFESGRYGPSMRSMEMAFTFPPTFYLFALVLGLVTTALIFCRMLPADKEGRLMNFRDALTLASVYQAFALAFVILLGLLVFVLITLLLAVF
jgi:hypothetical protein